MATVHGDPEAFMTLNLSRNLDQGMNPAYQLRDGFQTQSCMKSDFIWDQDEVSCSVQCNIQCHFLLDFLRCLLSAALCHKIQVVN